MVCLDKDADDRPIAFIVVLLVDECGVIPVEKEYPTSDTPVTCL
jgi:hypothetical protein